MSTPRKNTSTLRARAAILMFAVLALAGGGRP
jgi:hypothetical protein